TGCAKGQGRARLAAEQAISSPLLDDISVDGATGVLINIVGGPDMRMKEIEEAASLVQEQAHEDANIIFGATIDENMGEMIKVTVIATGFDRPIAEAAMQVQASRPQPLVSQIPASSAAPRERPAPQSTQRTARSEELAYSTRRPGPPPAQA